MNILMTGGAGYIGSILTPRLLALGHQVSVVDSFMYGQTSLLDCCSQPGLRVVRSDVRRADILRPLVSKAVTVHGVFP